MFKQVENNITNSLAVIADTSSATRFALFPGCYDEARKAWKGVKCYENGTFGTEIWFTKCYLLEVTGKQQFMGFIPHYTERFNPVETVLIPLWHNADGYSQHKGTDAKRSLNSRLQNLTAASIRCRSKISTASCHRPIWRRRGRIKL